MNLSIERQLLILYLLASIVIAGLCSVVVWLLALDVLESLTFVMFIMGITTGLFYQCYRLSTTTIDQISLQIEAIVNEEYNINFLGHTKTGRLASLRHIMSASALRLATKRQEYLDNEQFLFELISQLDIPMVVLDHHNFCYSSSDKFNRLINRSVSQVYGQHIESFGFQKTPSGWQQSPDSILQHRYEIHGYAMSRSGRKYQLLVLFSIETTLRQTEKVIWHRLIRVINHEVRNSLTPICSLTQSLQQMKSDTAQMTSDQSRELEILDVINQRSQQLLDFVDHYSAFSKLPIPKRDTLNIVQLSERLLAMFPTLQCPVESNFTLRVDHGQLEQSLINLIKNAVEANAECDNDNLTDGQLAPVILSWGQVSKHCFFIEVTDSGQGVSNQENLFVPFYSTKAIGVGVGLVLARELIRNQGGELTLSNRDGGGGAVARITLPVVTKLVE